MSAKLIQPSNALLASPIVVILEKNGGDIRLCNDYRLVNYMNLLMLYRMPLIIELLEELGGVLWYCSLEYGDRFWVVGITKRARKFRISPR